MYRRRLVFAAACLGMLVFGIVLTALGSVLPSLMARYGLGKSDAGSLFSVMSIGILIGSVVFGPVVDRRGYKGLLVACIGLILLGLEGIAFAPGLPVLVGAIALIGLGGGVVNGATNALVADISEAGKGASLSLLGVFFGVGAFGMPFALGLLQGRVGYAAIVAGIGAFVALPLLFVASIRFPAPKQPQGFPLRRAAGLARDPTLVLLGFILFFESGMEITVGGWTATYAQGALLLSAGQAAFFLSVYWLGMMVARLILGGVLRRVPPGSVLLASIAVAVVGALTMVRATSAPALATGCALVGFGFAAVYPVILGFVGDRYTQLSGTAFSFVLVMALVGGTVMPYATGVLGDAYGLRASFLLVPASLCCMAVVFLLARRGLAVKAAPAS